MGTFKVRTVAGLKEPQCNYARNRLQLAVENMPQQNTATATILHQAKPQNHTSFKPPSEIGMTANLQQLHIRGQRELYSHLELL